MNGCLGERWSHWRGIILMLAGVLVGTMQLQAAAQEAQSTDALSTAAAPKAMSDDILGMDLDQLAQAPVQVASSSSGIDMNAPVTSVTKEQSSIGKSEAAISMDLRLAYRPRKHLELAVVGQNLLQAHHLEFNAYPQSRVTEIPRGVYGSITWKY